MKRFIGWLTALVLALSAVAGTGGVTFASELVSAVSVPSESAAHSYTRQQWMQRLGLTSAQLTSFCDRVFGDMRQFKKESDVSSYGIRYSEDVNLVLSQILFDEDPTLFMINGCTFRYYQDTRVIQKIVFEGEYVISASEYASRMQECRQAASSLLRGIQGAPLLPEQMALLLHDRLALWCEYDQANAQQGTIPYMSHMLYGALVNRIAVCDGYAKAYKYLLAQVGIDSSLIRSEALDHAWNVVNLGGKYYHVDVTWDDPVWDVLGRVKHQNFLVSTAALRETGHLGSDYDITPGDTYYDHFFWREQDGQSAFQYVNGDIYFINKDKKLIRWDLINNKLLVAAEVDADFGLYNGYPKLVEDGGYLYYTTGTEVYRFTPATGDVERTFTLNKSQFPGKYLVGMEVSGDYLLFNVWTKEFFNNGTEQEESWRKFRFKNNEIVGIKVRTRPDKTAYYPGSTPTVAGLTVEGYYSDGETVLLPAETYTVSSFTTDTLGEKTVTVTYKEFQTTFSVYVTDKRGDVDGDDAVTSTDARLALQFAVQKLAEGALELILGDVDGDGTVTSTDARLMLQYAVKKIDRFPVEPEPQKELTPEEAQQFVDRFCAQVGAYRRNVLGMTTPMVQDYGKLQLSAMVKSAEMYANDQLSLVSPTLGDQYDLVRNVIPLPEGGIVGMVVCKYDFTAVTPEQMLTALLESPSVKAVLENQSFYVCAAGICGNYLTLLMTDFNTW